MTPHEQRVARRRARVLELHGRGESLRAIAERVGVGRSTVARDLAVVVPESDGRPVPNHAGPDNERAVTHGVYSERRIGPVREEYARGLAASYPRIDPARRALQAQRLAQIDLASAWLDSRGTVVRDEKGQVFDVADKLARWWAAAERWFADADAESRQPDVNGGLEALVERGAKIIEAREVGDGG
jgi:hypothetical protein